MQPHTHTHTHTHNYRAGPLVLTRTNGTKESVQDVVQGRTVLGLLRHLG